MVCSASVLILSKYVALGSSISTWVRNCEKLTLGEEEREQLDSFIDQLYADLDTGELFDQGTDVMPVLRYTSFHFHPVS